MNQFFHKCTNIHPETGEMMEHRTLSSLPPNFLARSFQACLSLSPIKWFTLYASYRRPLSNHVVSTSTTPPTTTTTTTSETTSESIALSATEDVETTTIPNVDYTDAKIPSPSWLCVTISPVWTKAKTTIFIIFLLVFSSLLQSLTITITDWM